jgi:hypothetical protein
MVTSTETAGVVRLTGSVEPQSLVFALNHATKSASGQYTESGDYDFTLEAQERDSISLWYQHGTMESPSNDFVIKLVPATP